MKILTSFVDIFNVKGDAICVTTNGITRKDGTAVMGAGIAKTANMRYNLDTELGNKLRTTGNHVYDMGIFNQHHIVTFPTKHHWRDLSDLELIKQSCLELVALADSNNWKEIYLPPVGCGCGGLDWDDVEYAISPILDDRFIIIAPRK